MCSLPLCALETNVFDSAADFVFVTFGCKPNSKLIRTLDPSLINPGGFVLVKPTMQLDSVPLDHIFAPGDVNSMLASSLASRHRIPADLRRDFTGEQARRRCCSSLVGCDRQHTVHDPRQHERTQDLFTEFWTVCINQCRARRWSSSDFRIRIWRQPPFIDRRSVSTLTHRLRQPWLVSRLFSRSLGRRNFEWSFNMKVE